MKNQRKSILIVFVAAGVFMGILVMHLSVGLAEPGRGGLPRCKAELNTCGTYLQICLDTPSLIPKTGQVECYESGDDGELQCGLTWPNDRFTDNVMYGTVTDNLTGLTWTRNATCDTCNWGCAVDYCKELADGSCGLTDGSSPSEWRLPNVREMSSLIDYGNSSPPLPTDHPFVNVGSCYWTSTTVASAPLNAWIVMMTGDGILYPTGMKYNNNNFNVWCVKGGLQIE